MVKWVRLHVPNGEGQGSIPGQVSRFHMLQLKILHASTKLKIPYAATKTLQVK